MLGKLPANEIQVSHETLQFGGRSPEHYSLVPGWSFFHNFLLTRLKCTKARVESFLLHRPWQAAWMFEPWMNWSELWWGESYCFCRCIKRISSLLYGTQNNGTNINVIFWKADDSSSKFSVLTTLWSVSLEGTFALPSSEAAVWSVLVWVLVHSVAPLSLSILTDAMNDSVHWNSAAPMNSNLPTIFARWLFWWWWKSVRWFKSCHGISLTKTGFVRVTRILYGPKLVKLLTVTIKAWRFSFHLYIIYKHQGLITIDLIQ